MHYLTTTAADAFVAGIIAVFVITAAAAAAYAAYVYRHCSS